MGGDGGPPAGSSQPAKESYPSCDRCPLPASYRRRDASGRIHRACTDHEPELEGWTKEG